MPQAGTSLLSSILAQNPRFEAGKPGGVLAAIYLVPQAWQSQVQFQTSPNEAAKVAVMRAMLQGYFASSDRPVAFEKSRGWLAHLEMAELLLNRQAKVLVPVRDMRKSLLALSCSGGKAVPITSTIWNVNITSTSKASRGVVASGPARSIRWAWVIRASTMRPAAAWPSACTLCITNC